MGGKSTGGHRRRRQWSCAACVQGVASRQSDECRHRRCRCDAEGRTGQKHGRINAKLGLLLQQWRRVLFCSLAALDPRVGHTVDVLSPFIAVLYHSDWRLFLSPASFLSPSLPLEVGPLNPARESGGTLHAPERGLGRRPRSPTRIRT